MADPDGHLRGLRDDRRVRAHVAEYLPDPGAGGLLVGDRNEDDPAAAACPHGLAGGHERSREAGLLVVRPAAGQPVAVDARLERRGHGPEPDGVEVSVEHEGRPAVRFGATVVRRTLRDQDVRPPVSEGMTRLASPFWAAQPWTNRAISCSPAPPGTRVGLTESMAMRCLARSMTSSVHMG